MKKISLLLTLALLVSMFTGVVFAAVPTDGEGEYTRVIFDGSSEVPTYSQKSYMVFEGGRITAVTDSDYTSAFSDNTLTVTKKSELTSSVIKRQLVFETFTPVTSGIAVFGFDFSTNEPMATFRTDGLYNSGSLLQGTYTILSGGKIFSDTEYDANEVYRVEIAVDLENHVTNYYLDGELVYTQELKASANTLTSLKFDWRGHQAVDDYIKLANPYMKWIKTLPAKSGFSYINADGVKNAVAGNSVNYMAQSVVIDFDDSFDEGYSAVLKKDGETVQSNAKTVDNSIVVTPEGGFEAQANYALSLTNLSANSKTMADVTVNFIADYSFEITSPASGAVIEDASSVKLSAVAPGTYTDVKFYLDGNEVNNAYSGGAYVSDVAWDDITLGNHTFTVEAKNGDLLVSDTVEFETTKNLAAYIDVEYEDINTGGANGVYPWSNHVAYSRATGFDGTENGSIAFNRKPGASNLGVLSVLNYGSPTVWYLDTYIKRDEGASFGLQMGGKRIYFGYNQLITADGIVGANKGTMPANEWHRLKLVVDTVNHTHTIWLDGVKIQDQTNYNHNNNKTTASQFYLCAEAASTEDNILSIYLDDTKCGAYYENPRVLSVAGADGNVVSALSNSITLNMSANFDAITPMEITVNGVMAADVVTDSASKTITIVPAEGSVVPNEAINIAFDSTLTSNSKSLSKEYVVRLQANGDVEDGIKNFRIEGSSAYVTLHKAAENSVYGDMVTLYIAGYSDGALVSLDVKDYPLSAGVNELSASIDNINGATSFKAFLWDEMKPLVPAK